MNQLGGRGRNTLASGFTDLKPGSSRPRRPAARWTTVEVLRLQRKGGGNACVRGIARERICREFSELRSLFNRRTRIHTIDT